MRLVSQPFAAAAIGHYWQWLNVECCDAFEEQVMLCVPEELQNSGAQLALEQHLLKEDAHQLLWQPIESCDPAIQTVC